MKLMTATVIFLTAISTSALAESPMQRDMHSWDYVQQTAGSALNQQPEAPVMDHHEQRPYYHHEGKHEGKHHHGAKHHHEGKHEGKPHHHHHHNKGKEEAPKPEEQPKQ